MSLVVSSSLYGQEEREYIRKGNRLYKKSEFAGSDMNLEGALALPRALRLFTRGNGAAKRGLEPVNATCDLSLKELLAYLAAPDSAPVPEPRKITPYALGALETFGVTGNYTKAKLVIVQPRLDHISEWEVAI
jgi:hypothetical protein